MGADDYRGISFDDPATQAQFEQLVQRVREAEMARQPIADQHRTAEYDEERGAISQQQYRQIDQAYIAANNAIAAAQHAVDAFLASHTNYRNS